MAIQEDGQIVLVGGAGPELEYDFAAARYTADGELDDSFDDDGRVRTDFGGRDRASSVALQPDGKIVLAGFVELTTFEAHQGLLRYNPDGSLDGGLDGDGRLIAAHEGVANAVEIDADGGILVAGFEEVDNRPVLSVARYSANGATDTGFSGDGRATVDFGEENSHGFDIEVQPDGKIVAAGSAGKFPSKFAAARFNPGGSLDTGFDGDGLLADTIGGRDQATAVDIAPDGKIVLGGSGFFDFNEDQDLGTAMVFARYGASGSPDTGFDGDGKLVKRVSAPLIDSASALTRQPDGKLIAVGVSQPTVGYGPGSPADFGIVRLNADGSLDESFGNGGMVKSDFDFHRDFANAVEVQSDGKIVVGGLSFDPSSRVSRFVLARYEPDGTPDTSFTNIAGGPGYAFFGTGAAFDPGGIDDLLIQPDGKILFKKQEEATGTAHLMRVLADGSGFDQEFGNGGTIESQTGNAIALQPDGKILEAGSKSVSGGRDFSVLRYNEDGSPDEDFGTDGEAGTHFGPRDVARALVVEPDGAIVVVGETGPLDGSNDFAIARHEEDGDPDLSFDGDGKATVDFGGDDRATDVGIQADQRILIGGSTAPQPGGSHDFALARLTEAGAPDASFSEDGELTTDFTGDEELRALSVSDGLVTALGSTDAVGGGDFALARYLTGATEPQRILNVSSLGTGGGTITGPGIDCGGAGHTDCFEAFAQGAQVTLSATPAGNSTFTGWSGACSGSGACSLAMSGDRAVYGSFPATLRTLTLQVGGSGQGLISGGGIECMPGNAGVCSVTVLDDTQLTLTAQTPQGSLFGGWSGACSGSGPCVVTMDSDKTVLATLLPIRTLSASIAQGAGQILGPGIDCGTVSAGGTVEHRPDCSEALGEGTTAGLTAVPFPGFTFAGWGGACSGAGSCTVAMNGDQFVSATFVRSQAIEVFVRGSGTVTSSPPGISCPPTCSASFPGGTTVSFSAAPAPGFVFQAWSGWCGGSAGCAVPLAADSVGSVATVHATFAARDGGGGNGGKGDGKKSGPGKKDLKCRKGFKRKKVKGKTRCVKKKRKPGKRK